MQRSVRPTNRDECPRIIVVLVLLLIANPAAIAEQDAIDPLPVHPPRPTSGNPPIPYPREATDLRAEGPAKSGGEPAEGRDTGETLLRLNVPYSTGRMYSLKSRELWKQVKSLLKEFKFKYIHFDRDNGVIQTKWINPSDLPDFGRDEGMEPVGLSHFRLHIFVSPFTEPGRLYVGSIVGGEDIPEEDLLFDIARPREWLFERLEERVGQAGHEIPLSMTHRYDLANRLLGNSNQEVCLLHPPKEPAIGFSRIPFFPSVIGSSLVGPYYPMETLRSKPAQEMTFKILVQEDGWIGEVKILDTTTDDALFRRSVMNYLYCHRFRPGKKDGCFIPGWHTLRISFSTP